ncbi:putative Late embryogenesis abundant protein, LEA-14 [Medicago truncatula]|uniref:Late embryogenesis abundant protein n=1 Tax=Medicago truncatula TaxID=3880 RepID=A0A072TMX2_MEDTR|nr:NDR1/HIN1-like protein 26 [Medicago truncatula]KEH18566.1 late embryogenesis abundant protein [Medicago truncatula]RHN39630.1 putative Late embryogenesis abundant protein, LEA-14 [Medicago truncatula]
MEGEIMHIERQEDPNQQPHSQRHFPNKMPQQQQHRQYPEMPQQQQRHQYPEMEQPRQQQRHQYPEMEQPRQQQRHQYPMEHKGMVPRYRVPNAPKREHCICITIFFLVLGIIILILWLAYHPSKPHITVTSAAIYSLNATSPPDMSISMQFTIFIRNPNKRVSIYFDRLSTFVSYRNHPITPHHMLPSLYLEKHETVSVSPVLGGVPVPVSVDVLNGLVLDENYGVVGVKLIFQGRLRWKTGEIKSAHYNMYAKCDLLLGLKKGLVGQIPLIGAPVCDVDT